MSHAKLSVVGVVAVVCSAAIALPSATAATSSPSLTPDQVTFDSTMVNHFAGAGNGPSGSETTEIQATITIAKQPDGSYAGSAMSKYAQATGTISETCMANETTGTTTETELSGNPTTFTATYTPASPGAGGSVSLDLGPLVGGLAESFRDHPGCGGPDLGNTTPRWLADFESIHSAQLTPSLAHAGDAIFAFPLAPTATKPGLPGAPALAGVYNSNGTFTNENLTAEETTAISLWATTSATATSGSGGGGGASCKVPNVKGRTLAAAKAAIRRAGCSVGTVKRRASSAHNRSRVLAQSLRAGSKHGRGTKVSLTIGR